MRRLLGIALLGGCGAMCVDVAPNVMVTSVCWDGGERRAQIASYGHLGYCTGSDEKRFQIGRVEIRPDDRTCAAETRLTNEPEPYDLAESCEPLFEDSEFPACQDCELRLDVGATGFTLAFVTDEELSDGNWSPLALHVIEDGEETMIVDLFGPSEVTDGIRKTCESGADP